MKTDTQTEIVQAIAELQERLAVEKSKDKMRARLQAALADSGLNKREAFQVVRAAYAKGARLAAPPVGTTRKTRKDKGKRKSPQLKRLQPAKGKVGKAIRAARLKAKISGNALAEKIGVGYGSISQWERGLYTPGPEVRAKLARELGIAPGTLTNGDARP